MQTKTTKGTVGAISLYRVTRTPCTAPREGRRPRSHMAQPPKARDPSHTNPDIAGQHHVTCRSRPTPVDAINGIS